MGQSDPAGPDEPILVLLSETEELDPDLALTSCMQDVLRIAASAIDGQRAAQRRLREHRVACMLNDLIEPMGKASDNIAALGILAETLCDRLGGVVCDLWCSAAGEQDLRLMANSRRGAFRTLPHRSGQPDLMALNGSLVGQALRTGLQIIIPDLARKVGGTTADGLEPGLRSLICTPFSSGDVHCALVLAFDTPDLDLEAMAEDLLRLRPLLNMLLRRLHKETELDLLRRVVETSRESIIVTRALPGSCTDLPIVYVNPAFAAMTGYSMDEAIGRTPRMLQCQDTAESDRTRIAQAIILRQPVQTEILNEHRSGTRYWIDTSVVPIFDTNGVCTHFVSMQRDCTAEHEARLEAERREIAFKALFDECPVPKLLIQPETMQVTAANRAAEKLCGYSAEAFRTVTALDLIEPVDHQALRQSWAAMLNDGQASGGIWQIRTASGTSLRGEVLSRRMQVQGQPTVLTVILDRTDQFAAHEAMLESKRELRHATNNLLQAQRLAQLGTWKWSPDTGHFECSQDLAAMLGRPAGTWSMSDNAFLSQMHDEDRPAMAEAFGRLRVGTPVFDVTFHVTPADARERVLLFSGSGDGSVDGSNACSGFCQDVTQRKLAEARLLRAEKLRSLGLLTGGITHDFNNLLAVISANLELALDDVPAGAPAATLLQNALRATDTGAKLNSHLLSFARRQPLRATLIAVQPFLKGVTDLARHTLGAGCVILLDEPTADLNVRADAAHLETALINLCLNARDAMPHGGTIHITHSVASFGRDRERPGREAEAVTEDPFFPGGLEELPAGRYGCISVSDTGMGMTSEIRARIFEPFFSTKLHSGGSGLGLSMVLGFAKQSGGGLSVESAPERGTCFRLYLPLEEAAPEAAPAPSRRPAPIWGRVLLVDDEEALRESTGLMLKSLGLEVESVADADAAMARLAPPLRFELLFSDVALGGGPDGIALCEWARAAWPDLAILLSSGFIEQQLRSDTLLRLRAEFLAKPYRRQALRSGIEAVLRGDRSTAPATA